MPSLPDRSLGDTGHVADHNALHDRYDNSVEVRSGTLASRPAASAVDAGTLWWATDTSKMSRSDGTTWTDLAAGATDHGALTGLADDDHTQYLNSARHASEPGHVTGGDAHDHVGGDGAQVDHGGLGGLADDDHTQYLTTARHAAIDAADHGSGAATDGHVLTADGAGGAAWEAAAGGGPQGKVLWTPAPHPYRAGAWYSARDFYGSSSAAMTAGRILFVGPFYVGQALSVDRIGFFATTAADNVRVALYSADSLGQPGTLVVESASTVVVANANAVTVASTQLTANIFYYLAVQFSSGAMSVRSFPSSSATQGLVPHAGAASAATDVDTVVFAHTQAFGAFPATPTLTTVTASAVPVLSVRTV